MSIITIVPKLQYPVITFEIKDNNDELINFGDHYYYVKHLKLKSPECILYYTNNIETFVNINEFKSCCDKNEYICSTSNKTPSIFSNYGYNYKDHEIFYNDTIQQKLFLDRFLQKDYSVLMLRNSRTPISNIIKVDGWLNFEIDYENLIVKTNSIIDFNNRKDIYKYNMRLPMIKICSQILEIYPEFNTINNVYLILSLKDSKIIKILIIFLVLNINKWLSI